MGTVFRSWTVASNGGRKRRKVSAWTGGVSGSGVGDELRERPTPLLGKEGWLRPLRKCCEASLAGADGVVGSAHQLSEVERTILPCFTLSGSHSLRSCPSAPLKERDHLFDWRGHPSFAKEGSSPFSPVISDPLSEDAATPNFFT